MGALQHPGTVACIKRARIEKWGKGAFSGDQCFPLTVHACPVLKHYCSAQLTQAMTNLCEYFLPFSFG